MSKLDAGGNEQAAGQPDDKSFNKSSIHSLVLQTEMTFTEGYTSDIQCPDDFTNSSLIASDPGDNAGFVVYYALQGAVFPPC